ncbi:aminopeptidase N-like [Planococcus citri]|uniref:aminopeptidase N-like n=1 Tax=Planococcus citri TaxID=170843 RepID=UPI0031FA002D
MITMWYFRLILCFVFSSSNILLVKGSSAPFNSFPLEQIRLQDGQQPDQSANSRDIYRLTDEVIPTNYELRIAPDLEKFTFVGKVEITIYVKFTTSKIILHSKKLTIKSIRVLKTDSTKTPVTNTHGFDETNDLLVVETSQDLDFGNEYSLIIEFQGDIGQDVVGFYRSSYTADDKETWMVTTQFEPNHAREAFPCFDEPRFRAPFTIYLARTTTQIAVSNMPWESQLPSDSVSGTNKIWEKFRKSPAMPTYLVAFSVSDFTYMANSENTIRIIARKNPIQQSQGSYALKQSARILKQLEGYTGIKYKLPKIDVVAVPDFGAGGMENWGMVTFKERFVLTDESTSSAQHRHKITQLISHEFAHQWFGNLVTPAWYNYLWLKEGFATYFETFTSAAIEPTWSLDQLYVIEFVQESLWQEVTSQRAMTTNVRKSNQLDSIFDIISYEKAGSIIRMFEHMVTPNIFRAALHRFLSDGEKTYEGVVVEKNLLDAFNTEMQRSSTRLPSRVTASDIMRTWSENIGYPLINVTRSYEQGTASIYQVPYKSLAAPASSQNQKWIVPLTYTSKTLLQFQNTQPTAWSFADEPTELKSLTNTDWVLFNLQHAGYYRVNYDTKNWNLLIEQLQQDHQKIHVLNRAQLISDAYALAHDEYLSYQVALKLTEYLSKETDMIPWYAAIKAFNVLHYKFPSATGDIFFKKHLYDLMKKSYDAFGYEIKSADPHVVKIVKPLFLMLACHLGIEDCIQKSLEEYEKNKADLTKIQPDLKRVVYCFALRHSKEPLTVFNNLWTTYTKYDISFEKTQILTALHCATNEEVIQTVISKVSDPQNKEIRKQDKSYLLTAEPEVVKGTLKFIIGTLSLTTELKDEEVKALQEVLAVIEYGIRTQDQITQLKDLETKLTTLNQKKYSELISTIKSMQSVAAVKIKRFSDKLDRVQKEYVLQSSTNTDDKSKSDTKPASPKPADKPSSAASISIPKLGWNLFAAGLVLCYSLSKFSML